MKLATTALLARPTAPADRGRLLLLSASTATAGGLLIAAGRIARMSLDSNTINDNGPGSRVYDLAPYLSDPGLRPGVVLGALLMTVPVFALAVQALRVGSVARDRRMSALRLVGATPRDVRAVAAAEAGGAAALGGLLAGPTYLALFVVLSRLLPSHQRLLPTPSVADLLVWLGVVVLLGLLGVVAGATVERRVLTDPLGVHRRIGDTPPGWPSAVASATGLVLVAIGFWLLAGHSFVPPTLIVVGLLVTAFAFSPVVARRRGLRLARRGSARDLLAGSRLAAEPRSAGRVAAVLAVCGVTLGMEAGMLPDLRGQSDLSFYLTGYAMVAVGVLVAVVIGVLTLLVGAADQLLDARRPLASLAALGVDERTLLHVLRRQLSSIAVPAVVTGVVVGGAGAVLLEAGMNGISYVAFGGLGIGLVLAAALLGGGLVALVCRLTTRLLRSRLREAIDPENLRVA